MSNALSSSPWRGSLTEACRQLGLTPDDGQLDALCGYLALLEKWNRTYNLTAVRDPVDMVSKHLLDSMAIAPLMTGRRLIDVGTGAGLPGIPLAIIFPEREFHLLDSNGKKTRFLFQVKTALGLDNITVHCARVESFRDPIPFDAVLSRAFASLADMVAGCRHLLTPEGQFLAMKGVYPQAELDLIANTCDIVAVEPIAVPGLSEARHLVSLTLR